MTTETKVKTMIRLVCSNKPRPSVQSNIGYKNIKTGACLWGRDVHHATNDKKRTLCGRDCSEWLDLDPTSREEALADDNLCVRCASRI